MVPLVHWQRGLQCTGTQCHTLSQQKVHHRITGDFINFRMTFISKMLVKRGAS
ncbi:hypothetical protein FKM82_019442 [Ascaphus truei]